VVAEAVVAVVAVTVVVKQHRPEKAEESYWLQGSITRARNWWWRHRWRREWETVVAAAAATAAAVVVVVVAVVRMHLCALFGDTCV
jgi:hypothetical protein